MFISVGNQTELDRPRSGARLHWSLRAEPLSLLARRYNSHHQPHWDQIAYTSPYEGGGPTMHTRSCIPPAHAHILRGGWNASVPCHCVGVKPSQGAPYMHCMKWGQLTSD